MKNFLSPRLLDSFLDRTIEAFPSGLPHSSPDCAALGKAWRALGLRPGDLVLLCMPNCKELLHQFFGVLMAGGVPALLPPMMPCGASARNRNGNGRIRDWRVALARWRSRRGILQFHWPSAYRDSRASAGTGRGARRNGPDDIGNFRFLKRLRLRFRSSPAERAAPRKRHRPARGRYRAAQSSLVLFLCALQPGSLLAHLRQPADHQRPAVQPGGISKTGEGLRCHDFIPDARAHPCRLPARPRRASRLESTLRWRRRAGAGAGRPPC